MQIIEKMKNLDEIDLKIIRLLRENGRMSLKELSSEVFLTPPAVAAKDRETQQRRLHQGDPRQAEHGKAGIRHQSFYPGQRAA